MKRIIKSSLNLESKHSILQSVRNDCLDYCESYFTGEAIVDIEDVSHVVFDLFQQDFDEQIDTDYGYGNYYTQEQKEYITEHWTNEIQDTLESCYRYLVKKYVNGR